MNNLRVSWWAKIKSSELTFIAVILLFSRIVLTFIGTFSRQIGVQVGMHSFLTRYHEWLPFDVWGNWDTGWYLSIVYEGYRSAEELASGQANYAFFPLYPMLVKGVTFVVGAPLVAGIIVSNFFLVVGLYYLYKLVLFIYNDHALARKVVVLATVFPTAFIYSGVLAESLLLALTVMAFYFAYKKEWWITGIVGLLLALTKSLGVAVLIPLIVLYLYQINWNIRLIRADIFALLLFPLGLGIFMLYNFLITGDWLAFATIQTAWGRGLVNPWEPIRLIIVEGSIFGRFALAFAAVILATVIVNIRKLPFELTLLVLIVLLIPIATSVTEANFFSLPRYVLSAFPVLIGLALWGKKESIYMAVVVSFALLQGFLMAMWVNELPFVV